VAHAKALRREVKGARTCLGDEGLGTMQRDAAKKVRQRFGERFLNEFKEFAKAKEQPFKGEVLYSSVLPHGITAFVLLLIGPREDRFTLEVAWSEGGQFPTELFCQLPSGVPDRGVKPDPPVNGQVRFRISEFWAPGVDEWWYLSGSRPTLEESMRELVAQDWANPTFPSYSDEQVGRIVDLAIEAIGRFVMPYFNELAKAPIDP
jgi:hypothetical protein